MARGFESKPVTVQQELADAPSPEHLQEEKEVRLRTHRRRLELSRADVQRRLEAAQAKPHREMLRRALDALDEEILSLR